MPQGQSPAEGNGLTGAVVRLDLIVRWSGMDELFQPPTAACEVWSDSRQQSACGGTEVSVHLTKLPGKPTGEAPMMVEDTKLLEIESLLGDVQLARFKQPKLLDEVSINLIGAELSNLAKNNQGLRLLVDFSNVQYLSSSALGMLITVNKHVRTGKGQMRLCCIRPKLLEVFQITRLDHVFEIHPTLREALESFPVS